ncbi:hypothetical protein ACPOL_0012 [Acidisarcina polymorpha]|uniref:Uncharacterized protein n=1 Tax=Acidisarcina polymorpha TaxID=2211140 RepID=A0A2Z5FRU3_9BACT|nr:hypothetical protein ACPOL_0012 [Acidisarcina polymorpha]
MWHDVVRVSSQRGSGASNPSSDAELAASLATLWPHRWHESNWLKNVCCCGGLHNWKQLHLEELLPDREVRFCYWCSKVKLDGVIYEG